MPNGLQSLHEDIKSSVMVKIKDHPNFVGVKDGAGKRCSTCNGLVRHCAGMYGPRAHQGLIVFECSGFGNVKHRLSSRRVGFARDLACNFSSSPSMQRAALTAKFTQCSVPQCCQCCLFNARVVAVMRWYVVRIVGSTD